MNIYLDLDGSLLDVSDRYYKIYSDLMKAFGIQPVSKAEYWRAKRSGREETLLKKAKVALANYYDKRMHMLELISYLKLDKKSNGVERMLSQLETDNHRTILVTLRKSKSNLHRQLQHLELQSLFNIILQRRDEEVEPWRAKASLISHDVDFDKKQSVMVGDTETDILAAKHLGIISVAVSSGLRMKTMLLVFRPDYIITRITDLPPVIQDINSHQIPPENFIVSRPSVG